MKIAKQKLLDILYSNGDDILSNEVTDTSDIRNSQCSTIYSFVFKLDGKLFQTTYGVGSHRFILWPGWEYESDEIECCEVESYEKTITYYRPVKKND